MIFTRTSMLTGKTNRMDLPLTADQLAEWDNTPRSERQLIQLQFPTLTEDQREFILSGATPEEWDEAFGE